jgi:hypothetical protein
MSTLKRNAPRVMIEDELAVLWHAKREAAALGYAQLTKRCGYYIACKYAQYIVSELYEDRAVCYSMTLDQCENSIREFAKNKEEEKSVLAHLYIRLADEHYWHGDYTRALAFYRRGRNHDRRSVEVCLKYVLLHCGKPGSWCRRSLLNVRRVLARQA